MNPTKIQKIPQEIYRADIEAFGKEMLKQLLENEHKGTWMEWRPTLPEWDREFSWHLTKLRIAHGKKEWDKVRELSADLAVLAMKAYCFQLYERTKH